MNDTLQILIVDDDVLVLEAIADVVERLNHTIVGRAMNGPSAIEMTKTLHPDLILMDIKMPGMDGLTAARKIQRKCPTPVVILTAHEDPDLIAQARESGVMAYIVKPPKFAVVQRVLPIARARFEDFMEVRRLNAELQDALATIDTLRGLIAICAWCGRKVQDDEGHWHKLESYVEDHTAARFTHGICPECLKELRK